MTQTMTSHSRQYFAQLSDPHLTTLEQVSTRELLNKRALGYLSWRRKRRFEHRPEVLLSLQQDLDTDKLSQLLVTGDLTHIGLPSEFQQARDWLKGLGSPEDIAVVPGNHDACVAAPWKNTFALWREYMEPDNPDPGQQHDDLFPSLRVRGDIAFIGVTTGVPKPPFMATGTAGDTQRQHVARLLRETARKRLFRVLYLHHCPVHGREKWRKRLTDAAQMQRVIEENGAELVLHGHGHQRQYQQVRTCDGNVPVIAVPSASAMGLHGADTAQYNTYGVSATEGGWELEINIRGYQKAYKSFMPLESSTITLNRRHAKAPAIETQAPI